MSSPSERKQNWGRFDQKKERKKSKFCFLANVLPEAQASRSLAISPGCHPVRVRKWGVVCVRVGSCSRRNLKTSVACFACLRILCRSGIGLGDELDEQHATSSSRFPCEPKPFLQRFAPQHRSLPHFASSPSSPSLHDPRLPKTDNSLAIGLLRSARQSYRFGRPTSPSAPSRTRPGTSSVRQQRAQVRLVWNTVTPQSAPPRPGKDGGLAICSLLPIPSPPVLRTIRRPPVVAHSSSVSMCVTDPETNPLGRCRDGQIESARPSDRQAIPRAF